MWCAFPWRAQIPQVSTEQLSEWESLPYAALAYNILRLYIPPAEIPDADLKRLVDKSYSTFRHGDVVPVVPVRVVWICGGGAVPSVVRGHSPPSRTFAAPHVCCALQLSEDGSLLVMEQFHGPTCAFKDVALQFVGNLFEFFLSRKAAALADPAAGIPSDPDTPARITVLGATSGDTGSAAIEGLRGKANIECVTGCTSCSRDVWLQLCPFTLAFVRCRSYSHAKRPPFLPLLHTRCPSLQRVYTVPTWAGGGGSRGPNDVCSGCQRAQRGGGGDF